MVTAHALIMIFFMVMPTLMGGFGNYFVPIQVGAPDIIFPRTNILRLSLLPIGELFLLCGIASGGGAGTSWTYYPPLRREGHYGVSVDFSIIRLHIAGVSRLVASFNFMTTILKAKGPITIEGLLLFCWTLVVTSFLLVLRLPVLGCGLTMLLFDRNINRRFFDVRGGGNALLYQHLFWFFGHPEVYILILPAFGIVRHATVIVSGKDDVDRYLGIVYRVLSIGLIGCVVWAHHIYVTGIDADSRAYFTAATMVIAIPTGIKVYTWLLTTSETDLKPNPVLRWIMGFIFIFTVGGVTGVILSNAVLDVNFHDTYFVVGHFHYVLSMGAVFGIFTGVAMYWPVVGKLAYNQGPIQVF
jgi:heme/copper-type cytochrome/quinol oxidase subunit 1